VGLFDRFKASNISTTDELTLEELMSKGLDLGNSEKDEKALVYFDKALAIDPQLPVAWVSKAFALSKLGRYDEALPCFDKAIEIIPDHPDAWANKALLLAVFLGRVQEALECCDKGLEFNPDDEKIRETKQEILTNYPQ
jgi:tetratricopeptide (TPR) repeat protein